VLIVTALIAVGLAVGGSFEQLFALGAFIVWVRVVLQMLLFLNLENLNRSYQDHIEPGVIYITTMLMLIISTCIFDKLCLS
jgi:ABC-type transport system involved in cytochrome c biogenesis permease component